MKLLDIFKKKPSSAKATEGKKEEIKPEIKKPKKKAAGEAYEVLVSPHITEKATELEKENKYVFKVFQKTNKIEIKKAIEGLYGVDVVNVKIINVPRYRKRLGRQEGWEKGYKKAIVKIKKGQEIEIMPR
ncbi:MAG: 50S ribosomal protein L23 [Candidatus Nealsonbacteria bacterium CG10_big_fil_rev_8_21_14_0_10_36_24]|uniref:Large ribosomal subunit protein uL23 n=2 Tax=Candidatus Nealsoniibacteriota TaxID=1817911 RepID=A0A2H0YMY3_9BACT|nr:MAG: 50S ribosomal protein L23 [Candidatus Nealsonbacteria bacterium CG10_big_fil_rev_8_21_14_0_10_36_24]PIS39867.1 MAG: 50S ribosomal protein L23 [Candidatus Nealsonbacteria bacterium CG08_land_8_20_14_0_20_36_22]